MTQPPLAFHDLPAEEFPLTLRFIDAATDVEHVDERIVVDGPGVIRIPGHTAPTAVEITFASGEVVRVDP